MHIHMHAIQLCGPHLYSTNLTVLPVKLRGDPQCKNVQFYAISKIDLHICIGVNKSVKFCKFNDIKHVDHTAADVQHCHKVREGCS